MSHEQDRTEQEQRDGECAGCEILGVGKRHNGQRDDVVDDHERQQERADAWCPASADQGEDPEGECGVGAHDDAPSPSGRLASVEREEDEGWDDEAAERGDDGGGQSSAFTQFADVELAPNLEARNEEEEGHEPVVDPVTEVEGQLASADPHRELRVPQISVAGRPRRVRPHERRHGRGEQDDGAGVLRRDELSNGSGEARQPWSLGGQRWMGHGDVLHGDSVRRREAPAVGSQPSRHSQRPIGNWLSGGRGEWTRTGTSRHVGSTKRLLDRAVG